MICCSSEHELSFRIYFSLLMFAVLWIVATAFLFVTVGWGAVQCLPVPARGAQTLGFPFSASRRRLIVDPCTYGGKNKKTSVSQSESSAPNHGPRVSAILEDPVPKLR